MMFILVMFLLLRRLGGLWDLVGHDSLHPPLFFFLLFKFSLLPRNKVYDSRLLVILVLVHLIVVVILAAAALLDVLDLLPVEAELLRQIVLPLLPEGEGGDGGQGGPLRVVEGPRRVARVHVGHAEDESRRGGRPVRRGEGEAVVRAGVQRVRLGRNGGKIRVN